MKNFFKNRLKYTIIAVHAFLIYSCNDHCTNSPTTLLPSISQKTDQELKSSAIQGLESIYFIDSRRVNPEIMTLLNYGVGREGEEYMRRQYEKIKKEIKLSRYISEEKSINSNSEQYTIRNYEGKNREGKTFNYLFYYNSESTCIGFIKYFKEYRLNDQRLAQIAQTTPHKEITSSNYGYLDLIAVKKSERKKSAATNLMNQCEKNLREYGKKFCILYTFNKDEIKGEKTALDFYKKRGYDNGLIIDDTTYMVKKL